MRNIEVREGCIRGCNAGGMLAIFADLVALRAAFLVAREVQPQGEVISADDDTVLQSVVDEKHHALDFALSAQSPLCGDQRNEHAASLHLPRA